MSKFHFSFLKICKFLRYFDLYGQSINLFVSKKKKFCTAGSGCISILIIILIFQYYKTLISSWVNRQNMTLIPSEISLSVTDLLARNASYNYTFDYTNYYLYFAIRGLSPEGKFIGNKDITKYLSTSFSYMNKLGNIIPLKDEGCNTQYQDIYLGLGDEVIRKDENKTSPNLHCIQNKLEMGLFPDPNLKTVNLSLLLFSINQCVNSSANNHSCASKEEIKKMLKYIQVQSSVPKTIYDFQSSQPNTNIYDYQLTFLDPFLTKNYNNAIIPTLLMTDEGLIDEDYKMNQINFNPDITYDPQVRDDSENLLFRMAFGVSFNMKVYRQKQNVKLSDVIGNMGGYLNLLFLMGKMICFAYNGMHLKIKIIKNTFNNKISRVGSKSLCQINENNQKIKLEFGFRNLCGQYFSHTFWGSKEGRKFYEIGSKRLNEYLDIRKIIKRLQDVDKMKIVLFNEEQRKHFETIPKPDIMQNSHQFSLDNMIKYSKLNKSQIFVESRKLPKTNFIYEKEFVKSNFLESVKIPFTDYRFRFNFKF